VQPGAISLRFNESTEERPIYNSSVRADSLYTIVLAPERDGVTPHAAWLVSDDYRGEIPQLVRFDLLSSVRAEASALAGNLDIFPSPASSYVEFSLGPELIRSAGVSYRIVDGQGRIIVDEKIEPARSAGNTGIVDCSRFASGIYHVLIYSADRSDLIGTAQFVVLH
jgi:hypothetical protein